MYVTEGGKQSGGNKRVSVSKVSIQLLKNMG